MFTKAQNTLFHIVLVFLSDTILSQFYNMDATAVRDSEARLSDALSMTRHFSDVYVSRWDEIRHVSRNLLELALVHLEHRVLCEADTEFFAGLLQGRVEEGQSAMVHSREQVVQAMVAEVGQSSK